MTFKEAKEKVCPYLGKNCILEECMFWNTTVNGKKEIDKQIEPYDMTPMDIANWADRMKRDGYKNIGSQGGFRDYYVKYEENQEGCCSIKIRTQNDTI